MNPPCATPVTATVLLVSDELGIYLGNCMGLGFWSKLDAAGQDAAVTFPSEDVAREHMAGWDEAPSDVRFVPVLPDDGEYATMQACVRAGLHPWLHDGTATANPIERPI